MKATAKIFNSLCQRDKQYTEQNETSRNRHGFKERIKNILKRAFKIPGEEIVYSMIVRYLEKNKSGYLSCFLYQNKSFLDTKFLYYKQRNKQSVAPDVFRE